MTSPRTPRQWAAWSDEPPASVQKLVDRDGNLVGRDANGNWLYLTVDGKVQDDSCSVPWSDLDDEYDMGWPLSEVLPETPEPPQAPTDRDLLHQNVRFAIADPGHFLPRKADEPVSHWSARAVMDVLGMLDMLGAPGEGYTVLASQPVPAVPVSATGGKETGEAAETATEADGPSPWDAYVAAYRAYQETDPHGATAHPTAHHMHALEAALRVAGLPLPDSEASGGEGGDVLVAEVRSIAYSLRGEALTARRLRALADDVDEIALKVQVLSPPLPDSETPWTPTDPEGEAA